MNRVTKNHLIYSFSPDIAPVLKVSDGATVVFETRDCFEDQIQSVHTPFEQLDWNRINPATGPIYIDGAEPGDILVVKIGKINHSKQGVMVTGKDMGAIGDQLTRTDIRIIPIEEKTVIFSDDVKIELNPMIGVIGTAPATGSIPCGTPGEHGGNMDCKLVTEGTTLYLPVNVPGALLALGDLHAAMGDGEVSVCGVEVAGEVTLSVSVLKGKNWPLPIARTGDSIFTIASEKTLDEAAVSATKNMVNYLGLEYGLSDYDAINFLSIGGNLRICQIVDPQKTIRCEVPLKLLAQINK